MRRFLPQLIEGCTNRRGGEEYRVWSEYRLCRVMGISFTLKTGLLDAWLLFLPTDILGVLAMNSLLAFGLGAIWGVLRLTCLLPVNRCTALPVDVLGSLGELSSAVVCRIGTLPAGSDLTVWLRTQALSRRWSY
ncbi:YhfT family protein [Shigella flexneri]